VKNIRNDKKSLGAYFKGSLGSKCKMKVETSYVLALAIALSPTATAKGFKVRELMLTIFNVYIINTS
jgi:hypothetical protein